MYLPVMINLVNKNITIIGAGKVAFRKIQKLINYSSNITIVAPVIVKEIQHLEDKKQIRVIRAEYKPEYIESSFLVIAATSSSDVNNMVVKDCEEKRILCNLVDKSTLSNCIFPSTYRNGDLSISVSTEGQMPLLSKRIIEEIKKQYTNFSQEYIKLLGEIRSHIINFEGEDTRKIILKDLLSKEIEELREIKKQYERRFKNDR